MHAAHFFPIKCYWLFGIFVSLERFVENETILQYKTYEMLFQPIVIHLRQSPRLFWALCAYWALIHFLSFILNDWNEASSDLFERKYTIFFISSFVLSRMKFPFDFLINFCLNSNYIWHLFVIWYVRIKRNDALSFFIFQNVCVCVCASLCHRRITV